MSSSSPTATDQPSSTVAALLQARRDKVAKLQELGIDPWGSRFDDAHPIETVRKQGDSIAQDADDGPTVRVAGRIMLLRNAGRLVFLDLVDRTGRIQVMIGKKQVGADIWPVVGCLDLGDIIGVEGRLGYSNSGEMTIFASSLTFLTKSLDRI